MVSEGGHLQRDAHWWQACTRSSSQTASQVVALGPLVKRLNAAASLADENQVQPINRVINTRAQRMDAKISSFARDFEDRIVSFSLKFMSVRLIEVGGGGSGEISRRWVVIMITAPLP